MKATKKRSVISFTYSLPSIYSSNQKLKNSGLAIVKNTRKSEIYIRPRFFSDSETSSPQKPVNLTLLPHFYAQNLDNRAYLHLPFTRKVCEVDILCNVQLNQVRSYTDNLLI